MLTLLLWNGYGADLRVLSIHAERKKEKRKEDQIRHPGHSYDDEILYKFTWQDLC